MSSLPPVGRYFLPFPSVVQRVPHETDESIITAVLTRNAYPWRLHDRVSRDVARQLTKEADKRSLADALVGTSNAVDGDRDHNATRHMRDCRACADGLGSRWACRRCARGRIAAQTPHLDQFVCRKHHVWIGPGATPSEQRHVRSAVVRADRRCQKLLRAGQIDVAVLLELDRIVQRWAELTDQRLDAAERFTVGIRIWFLTIRELDVLSEPFVPFRESYRRLQAMLENLPQLPQSAPLVDGIWAIIRAVALRRWEIACGTDVYAPELAAHWPTCVPKAGAEPQYPVQPFERYDLAYRTSQPSQWETENQRYVLSRHRAGVRWDVSDSSNEQVDIACPRGHRTTTTGNNRRLIYASRNHGCGICHGRRARSGFNSLADMNRATAERWHPLRNGDLSPKDVVPGSMRRVWWRCRRGHDFQSTVTNMSRANGASCPVCARRTVMTGETGLDVTHPHLVDRWHPTRNGALTPADVLSGSGRIVWWLCPDGHAYDSAVSVVTRGGGCGVCRGLRPVAGVNTLADLRPELASQWHATRNGEVTPWTVTVGSGKLIWWRCERGHDWQARVYARAYKGCPVCANLSVRRGVNALSDTHPDLAAEWHPTKNGEITPDEVVAGSPKRYWWVCALGHEYQHQLLRRSAGSGCVYCNNKKVLPGFNDAFTRFRDLMRDWDFARNSEFDPAMRLAGGAKHYWRCFVGHETSSTIPNRRTVGGCPLCAPADRASTRKY